ncbi:magnesium chelatase [Paenibacillus sp. CAA11]|uniref:AAA family ATPase n=1 Tax=Paenibacillus sp. CAA11 TaxID=1532905 RepID=UPI000D3DC42A|nr:MoxR family ATPase [Paenibacillus sp. CAA11]AWB43106.1 magnesium chelatase [Paenibacillus sp. CAA11]
MDTQNMNELINSVRQRIAQVVVGREEAVELLLTTLLAGGHALLEDVPGTGKTLLAKSLAASLSGAFRRIQFTPDLLPSDLSGIHYFNPKTSEFEFRPGPVFTHILLADEINRATPRTQSSLLECMEERQVTIDGETHLLEAPFMVIATQNPVDNQGTFPLPEAQLDRFLMRIRMGYPEFEEGMRILRRFQSGNPLARLEPAAEVAQIVQAQQVCAQLPVEDDLIAYILRITEATRTHPEVRLGASPRASQALLRASQALALVRGRSFVSPDEIKAVAVPVLAHRLQLNRSVLDGAEKAEELVSSVLKQVTVPTEPVETAGTAG